jgi:hypothetical protein
MNQISRSAALILFTVVAATAQESLSVTHSSWKGIEIRFLTRIEPDGTRLPGGVTVDSGRVHHVINDNAHKRSFGYDLVLEVSADGKIAQLRIEPVRLPGSMRADWTLLELPKYPVIPDVRVGDTVALDLLVNSTTGQKVVDYLTLRRHGEMDLSRDARDFSLADVEMSLLQPRIWVNGKIEGGAGHGGVVGAVIWINISSSGAAHGRYILSLLPNEKLGFKKTGVVSEFGLRFRDGTTEIRIECGSRVAPGPGNYNLYVVHEGNTRGNGVFGSADRAEWAIAKD